MKLGLIVRNSGKQALRAVEAIPRIAEDSGFDSAWVSDHLLVPPGFAERHDAEWLEATVALTHAAARTDRIRLGFSALILPYRPPVLVAQQVAALAALAPGRITVAAGIGWLKEEFDALGVSFDARADATDTAIGEIRRRSSVEVLAAGNSRASMMRAALICHGWHPIALSPGEIRERNVELQRLQQRGTRIVLRARFSIRDEASERPLYGPAGKIRDDLAAYEQAGVDELLLDHATPDLEETTRQIFRFCEEVRLS